MLTMRILLIATALAGAAQAQTPTANAPVTVISRRGLSTPIPLVTQTATGLRVRGSICRDSATRRVSSIRLEHIGAGGQILSSTSEHLFAMEGRDRLCAFYTASTDWTITPGEHINLCASNANRSCTPTT